MTQRELATILAALRYWQRCGLEAGGQSAEDDIATDGGTIVPLNTWEIDSLCYRLNGLETQLELDFEREAL